MKIKKVFIFPVICLMLIVVLCAAAVIKMTGSTIGQKETYEPDTSFLNIYGEEVKTPDKSYVYNDTVMAGNGKLFRTDEISYKFKKNNENKNIDNFIYIFNSIKNDYPILYVQRPCKYNRKTDVLPYGYTIELDKKYDYWCRQMRNAGIPVLDLRTAGRKHFQFYAGDHHWTIETSYYAAKAIERKLAEDYPDRFAFDSGIYKRSRFNDITRDGFLGEEAERSDKLFMGSEKITFLIPEYNTEYEMYKYDDGQLLMHKAGSFEEALIDMDKLNQEEASKYNASLFWAKNEVRIYNHTSRNNKKILLVANSLGRSMTMYLSLGFYETRYIDPQKDRFNDSILEYIKEYDPDFVVVMLNQSIKKR